jgi:hypothetical protein
MALNDSTPRSTLRLINRFDVLWKNFHRLGYATNTVKRQDETESPAVAHLLAMVRDVGITRSTVSFRSPASKMRRAPPAFSSNDWRQRTRSSTGASTSMWIERSLSTHTSTPATSTSRIGSRYPRQGGRNFVLYMVATVYERSTGYAGATPEPSWQTWSEPSQPALSSPWPVNSTQAANSPL